MKLSLYSGNLSTYYKSITLVESKNSCTSLIMNGLYLVAKKKEIEKKKEFNCHDSGSLKYICFGAQRVM